MLVSDPKQKTNTFCLASAWWAPCKKDQKMIYLNLNSEIPTSDNAHHNAHISTPPSHVLVEISQQYIWEAILWLQPLCLGIFCCFFCFISHLTLTLFLIIMDTTNNSIILSLAELALHLQPCSAPPLSTQLPPTWQHSTLITQAPGPVPSIHQSQLHSTPMAQLLCIHNHPNQHHCALLLSQNCIWACKSHHHLVTWAMLQLTPTSVTCSTSCYT